MNLDKVGGARVAILPVVTITTAVANGLSSVFSLPGAKYVLGQAVMAVGTGGTSIKAYLQTSLDGGTTWNDIMSFAFANTPATKQSAVVTSTALAAGVTPASGSLADNTILSGLLGDQFRVRYITVGTYSGGTTLKVDIVAKG